MNFTHYSARKATRSNKAFSLDVRANEKWFLLDKKLGAATSLMTPSPSGFWHLSSSHAWCLISEGDCAPGVSHLYLRWCRCGSSILAREGPAEFWLQGGPWAQHFLKIGGFPKKLCENCMILEKSWGQGGPRPSGPLWIRLVRCPPFSAKK